MHRLLSSNCSGLPFFSGTDDTPNSDREHTDLGLGLGSGLERRLGRGKSGFHRGLEGWQWAVDIGGRRSGGGTDEEEEREKGGGLALAAGAKQACD